MELKTGNTITFEAGYHTIEFSEPIQITGNNFVVMIEAQGEHEDYITMEMEYNFAEYIKDLENPPTRTKDWLNNVTVESGKCFYSYDRKIESNEWIDTSTMKERTKGATANFDTTIKAFTRSTLEPNILQSIEIVTPPSKTSYIVGEDFDKTGMVVKAKYSDGSKTEISMLSSDVTANGFNNKVVGKNTITITYKDKTVQFDVEIKEENKGNEEVKKPQNSNFDNMQVKI